jgi:hypothetical protein
MQQLVVHSPVRLLVSDGRGHSLGFTKNGRSMRSLPGMFVALRHGPQLYEFRPGSEEISLTATGSRSASVVLYPAAGTLSTPQVFTFPVRRGQAPCASAPVVRPARCSSRDEHTGPCVASACRSAVSHTACPGTHAPTGSSSEISSGHRSPASCSPLAALACTPTSSPPDRASPPSRSPHTAGGSPVAQRTDIPHPRDTNQVSPRDRTGCSLSSSAPAARENPASDTGP